MQRHFFGLAAVAGILVAAGCASDPTGDLSGDPARIVTSLSRVFLQPGDSTLVTAEVRDAQGVGLATLPEVTSADPGIIEVMVSDLPPFLQRRFYVKSVGAGTGRVILTAGSVSDTVGAVAFPATFDGAITVTAGDRLDTVTIAAGSLIGFDTTGSTTVLINGEPTLLVSRTATEVKVLALSTAAITGATVTLQDAVFLPGTDDIELAEIDADQTINISGEADEPGNDDPGDAPGAIALGGEAVGSLTASDVDDYFVLTLAAPAAITITTSFAATGSDPDIDVFLLNATGGGFCVLDNNCAMATGANPEAYTTAVLPAGTYMVLVELFDIGDADEPTWYRLRIQ